MTKNHRKTRPSEKLRRQYRKGPGKSTFGEHLYELRRRLVYIALSVIAWGIAAYAVERQLINALLLPAHGQSFIYTSPISGMNFIFRVCLYAGIALSIPVIVYQFLRYIEPLLKQSSAKFVRFASLASGILAVCGMAFGYFIGMPAALHFLLHQFVNVQIRPLLTIDAYLSFVTVYMLGAALMFQVPLILICINRIKPLNPKTLFHHERWAILFAVVIGGIMNPTPNLFDQLFVVGPIIATYQVGILFIYLHNHTSRHKRRTRAMLAKDTELQAERQKRLATLQTAWDQANEIADTPTLAARRRPAVKPVAKPAATVTAPAAAVVPKASPRQPAGRPRNYVDGFVTRRRIQA